MLEYLRSGKIPHIKIKRRIPRSGETEYGLMDRFERGSPSDFIVTARPNCSLTGRGRLVFFSVVALVSFGIASVFAFVGAWMVLPFAGLEIAAFGLAMYLMHRSANDYERIAVSGDHLQVERCQRNRTVRSEFQCYWAQVILKSAAYGKDCRLFVRSHGKQIEVGQYRSTEQRIELARELKIQLGRR